MIFLKKPSQIIISQTTLNDLKSGCLSSWIVTNREKGNIDNGIPIYLMNEYPDGAIEMKIVMDVALSHNLPDTAINNFAQLSKMENSNAYIGVVSARIMFDDGCQLKIQDDISKSIYCLSGYGYFADSAYLSLPPASLINESLYLANVQFDKLVIAPQYGLHGPCPLRCLPTHIRDPEHSHGVTADELDQIVTGKLESNPYIVKDKRQFVHDVIWKPLIIGPASYARVYRNKLNCDHKSFVAVDAMDRITGYWRDDGEFLSTEHLTDKTKGINISNQRFY